MTDDRSMLMQDLGDDMVVVDLAEQRAYSLAAPAAKAFSLLPVGDRRAFLRTSALVTAGTVAALSLPVAAAAASTTTTVPSGPAASVESFDTQLPTDMEFSAPPAYGAPAEWSESGNPTGSMLVTQFQQWRFTGTRFLMGPVMSLSLDVLIPSNQERDIVDIQLWSPALTSVDNVGQPGLAIFRLQTDYDDGGFFPQGSSPRIPRVVGDHWLRVQITSDGTTVTATVSDLTNPTAYSAGPVTIPLMTLMGTSNPSGTVGQTNDGGDGTGGHFIDNITLTNS